MAAYSLAIFTGAFLLFQVQPLIGKFLLPWFGGAPAVWTTCMLVFQLLLLAGYGYAHVSRMLLRTRHQVLLHLALLVAAVLALPIVPAETWKPADATEPTLRLVALLVSTIGLPYVVLAGTAPLLQHWFTGTHPGRSPFRLYALSNLGSLIALLSYPVAVETLLTRQAQATLWGAGLLLYAAACVWVALGLWKAGSGTGASATAGSGRVGRAQNTWWVLLPACASLLLLAVTNKTSQDVAAIPLLWILPLSLYLVSFIVCFEKPTWYERRLFGLLLMISLGAVTLILTSAVRFAVPVQILVYNGCLFVCCMVCHGEVYRLRPAPEQLTAFYLWIAVGGALGGLLVGVVAPAVFPDYFELQFGLVACGVLFLSLWSAEARPWQRKVEAWPWWATFGLLVCLAAALWHHARQFAEVRVYRGRNFYGVLSVLRHENRDPAFSLVEMLHGQMAHGMQFLHPERRLEATLYYSTNSGVAHALDLAPAGQRHVGIVGLGAGTLAVYGTAGDRFRFYEINPQVEYAASNFFTYLKQSAADTHVVLGDARLRLEAEPAQGFDVLVLDAFSSDAIPFHLLTREAFAIYERHLKPSGAMAVHISNRSVNLEPPLRVLAEVMGYSMALLEHRPSPEQWWVLPSTWVLLTREAGSDSSTMQPEEASPALNAASAGRVWTDDYAALVPILRWNESIGSARQDPAAAARAGANLAKVGDVEAAIRRYREAVEINPASVEALNNLACLLATAPDPTLRDGVVAVQHAEKACQLTGFQHPILLSTLAAAYAQAGRFEEAVVSAEKACQIAEVQGDQELLTRTKHFLSFYGKQQVYPYPSGKSPEPVGQ